MGEVFNPEARDTWDDRIAYHLKMIEEWTSKEIQSVLSSFSPKKQGVKALQAIEKNYGGGLPNFPSSNIIQQLYQPYHRNLEKPCQFMVLWVEQYMTVCLDYILDKVLPSEASYKSTLGRELSKIIIGVMKNSREKCMESVEQMLKMEEKVFTVNPHYMTLFDSLKAEGHSNLFHARIKKILLSIFSSGGASASTTAPQAALIGLRAYCSIVHARMVDHLSQLCEYWFIRNGVLVLDEKLSKACSPGELLKWMKEAPVLEQRRAHLRRSIEAMENALAVAESD